MAEFPLTIEMLRKQFLDSNEDMYSVIHYGRIFEKPYPENQFKKPFLKSSHTSEEAEAYAKDLKEYEKHKSSYEQAKVEVREWNNKVNNLMEDFVKEESGLNDLKSEKQRDKVWSHAWERCHDSGLGSIYYEICELIEIIHTK